MTQEEFNRRQQQAVNYLDDARRKLEKTEELFRSVDSFLDDVEQELDYLKDYGDEKEVKVEPEMVFEYENKSRVEFIIEHMNNLTGYFSKQMRDKYSTDDVFDIIVEIFIEKH